MKRTALVAIALAVGLTGAVDGYAADKDKVDRQERAAWRADANHLDSKTVIGMKVRGADGKDLGEVDRLLVNMSDGKVSHAVIGVGGVAGIGERHVVVPWSQIKFGRDDRNNPVATIDRATLESAPRYTADRDRDRVPAASPATRDRDRDGVRDRTDRAPDDSKKQ
jgi:sporulation protein YlmC with PRC-barrel domain